MVRPPPTGQGNINSGAAGFSSSSSNSSSSNHSPMMMMSNGNNTSNTNNHGSINYATTNNQTEAEKTRIESEVHRLVTSRDKKYTNFIEYNNYKLIYRRYAGLFFTLAVDVHDNELSYLESIHLFVELLDSYFANVCELDIVFNFNKVYLLLDEYMLAGEIEETSKREILDRVKYLEKLD